MIVVKCKFFLIFIIFIITVNCKRIERGLAFPRGSAMGLIVAAAFPVDVPNINFYCSTNFEANYGLPSQASDFTKDLYNKVIFGTEFGTPDMESEPEIEETTEARRKRSTDGPINRKIFYEMLERKMEIHGINGRPCLLKTICQVAFHQIHRNNAVHGNIFHVLFTPSTSKHEDIDEKFYEAEIDGIANNCSAYQKKCQNSLFDLVFIQ